MLPRRVYFSATNGDGVGDVLEENHDYPFGQALESDYFAGGANPYRYNGKERVDAFDLGWYDYGARWYAAELGRWGSVDPLADLMPGLTPYRYGLNNPILYLDPLGLFETRAEAREYREQEGIKGRVRKQEDGSFAIVHKGSDGNIKTYNDSQFGVVTEIGFVNTADDNKKSLGAQAYEIWNSPFARTYVPDIMSIGVGFTGIAGVGAGTSFEANWVLRGPQASILPAITTTQNVGVGFSMDVTLNFGTANYLGPVESLYRNMLQTSIQDSALPSVWISGGFTAGGKIGFSSSWSPTETGYGIVGGQINIGGGLPTGPLPFNGAGGVSNTFILHDFYKK